MAARAELHRAAMTPSGRSLYFLKKCFNISKKVATFCKMLTKIVDETNIFEK
jgi:hypothetical protein